MARNATALETDETTETTPATPPTLITARVFDPAAHLRKIRTRQGMQDYLDVKWRVQWLRSEYPAAQIVTEQIAGDAQFARFKCTISLPNGAMSSGHGSETAGDFPDFYEKAETKSIGRACAALGYGTDAATDFDDGEPLDGRGAAKDERSDRVRRDGPDAPPAVPSAPAPERAANVTPISQPRPAVTRRAPANPNGPVNGSAPSAHTGGHGSVAVPVPAPELLSNNHQHTLLHALAASGFDLAARLKTLGVGEIESLTREQAKEVIIEGRATSNRQPVAASGGR